MTRPLTPLEDQALRGAAAGRSTYRIAVQLGRPERDVSNALARAIRALGARSLDHAIQLANQPTGDQP